MRSFQEIKDNYRFTERETETLNSLYPVIEPYADRVISDFYNFFLQIPDAARFLRDEERQRRLPQVYRDWLLSLFQGPYDERYFRRLKRIGHAHVRIGLSAHFVYVGMNLIREHLHRIVQEEVEPKQQDTAMQAVEKILDLNLDVIARTYHEEEMRRVFISFRLDNALMRVASRFTFGLNLLVLIGLIALSLGVLGILANDIATIFGGQWEKGLASALGSLLILWLMIELLDAEIERLQGGSFKFNLFVGVALVAFIRKVLVASLTHESVQVELTYIGGILVLGLVFWVVSRAEAARR